MCSMSFYMQCVVYTMIAYDMLYATCSIICCVWRALSYVCCDILYGDATYAICNAVYIYIYIIWCLPRSSTWCTYIASITFCLARSVWFLGHCASHCSSHCGVLSPCEFSAAGVVAHAEFVSRVQRFCWVTWFGMLWRYACARLIATLLGFAIALVHPAPCNA